MVHRDGCHYDDGPRLDRVDDVFLRRECPRGTPMHAVSEDVAVCGMLRRLHAELRVRRVRDVGLLVVGAVMGIMALVGLVWLGEREAKVGFGP